MPKFSVVMVSGCFDPFHDGHLSYLRQVVGKGTLVICIVASDKQIIAKKGKVVIPEEGRRRIVDAVLRGLSINHITLVNKWDTETTLIAQALRAVNPEILLRGGDKTLETMPPEERQVCEELGTKIEHAKFEVDRHGSRMGL